MKMVKKKHEFGVAHLSKREINHHDLRILNYHPRGLLDIKVKHSITGVTFYYDLSQDEPLINTLQKPMQFIDFQHLLENIIHCFIELEKQQLSLNNLLLDINYIYYNPYSKEIEFAYIPHFEYIQEIPIKNFFLELVQYCHFLSGDAYEKVQEYIDLISKREYFDYSKLLSFLSIEEVEEHTLSLEEETVDLHPPKLAYLVNENCKIVLDHFPFTIGSSKNNDYCISNPAVSRRHAKIEKEDEEYYLYDLGSKNYTFVNDIKVEEKQLLLEGKVTFANEEFSFMIE